MSKKHPRYDERKKGRKKERGIFLWSSSGQEKKSKTNRMDIPIREGENRISPERARGRASNGNPLKRLHIPSQPHRMHSNPSQKYPVRVSSSLYARRLMRPIERAKICAYARTKKKEGRTAVCNNSSSYWPARVTTLVLLATAALETTTFAPNNVDWVSADIICVCVRYKK